MAVHGKATGLVLGTHNVTRMFKDITVGRTTEATDATMFQSPGSSKEYVAGMADATVSGSGRFEGSQAATQAVLEDAASQGVDTPFLVSWGSGAVGARAMIGLTLVTAFDVSSPATDLVGTKLSLQADGGMRSGELLASALVPVTGVLAGASYDHGTSYDRGGIGQLHVVANTWTSATVVKLQHSADNATWADLVTFASIPAGGVSTERIVVGGPIQRYTRALITPDAGTGQLTIVAALARN